MSCPVDNDKCHINNPCIFTSKKMWQCYIRCHFRFDADISVHNIPFNTAIYYCHVRKLLTSKTLKYNQRVFSNQVYRLYTCVLR